MLLTVAWQHICSDSTGYHHSVHTAHKIWRTTQKGYNRSKSTISSQTSVDSFSSKMSLWWVFWRSADSCHGLGKKKEKKSLQQTVNIYQWTGGKPPRFVDLSDPLLVKTNCRSFPIDFHLFFYLKKQPHMSRRHLLDF